MIERCSWAWVALVLAAGACSKDVASEPSGPQFVPTVGGQSGQEGACLDLGITELPYDPEAVFARALGRHTTRILWNDGEGTPQPATFEIKARGKLDVDSECGPRAVHRVSVRMQVPSAGVDVEFEALGLVMGADGVVVWSKLDGDFKSTLSKKAEDVAWHFDDPAAATKHNFDLWWYDGEITGRLNANKGLRDWCHLAIWPEAFCGSRRVAFPQDKRIDGFDAQMVLDMVRGLGEQLLTWGDGAVTHVQFDLEPAAGSLCVTPYLPHSKADSHLLDASEIQVPVTIHVTTSDGRVDTRVPGGVTAVVSRSTGMQTWFEIESGFLGPRAAVEAAGVRPISDGAANTLGFSLGMRRDVTDARGTVSVWEQDWPTPPSKLQPTWQERPIGGVCSTASVGLGASEEGLFEIIAP